MSNAERFTYMLDDIIAEQSLMRSNEREMFRRINELEKRMAQVVVIAVLSSLCLPIVVESLLR
jgi:hypothetical protein